MTSSLNVGILGHVDAGKTTLTRAIASLASTMAFDKHAKEEGRHNTIDLGFSSLVISSHRLALIDCPGHAGLIRAVLAASSVFDAAIVVIDVSKGLEPQTAEHLLLASIFCPDHVMIVLNKVDLVEKEQIPMVTKRIRKALKSIGINENSSIVPISLLNISEASLHPFLTVLESLLYNPVRLPSSQFIMSVDHCFSVKGKGTILTGTITEGSIKLNSEVEIPSLKEKRKIKGLQSWKESIEEVSAGERCALLVSNLPPSSFQRGVVCEPGALSEVHWAFATVNTVEFFKGDTPSNRKFHVSTGFDIMMAECQFLRRFESEYELLPECSSPCEVLLHFVKPIFTKEGSFYIASKLDHQGKGCRFVFHGKLYNFVNTESEVKKFVRKTRKGVVERIENDRSVICKDLFKKETKISIFVGMTVVLSTGGIGRIESPFGKNGKARISISDGLCCKTKDQLEAGDLVEVSLYMKKYLHDRSLKSYVP